MLVLVQKRHEAVCIDETVRVTVLEVRGNRVRLGIAAPVHMPINRGDHRRCEGNRPECADAPGDQPILK